MFQREIDDQQPVYVELPPEDPEHGRKCGQLNRHLYGTRGAAAGWECEYSIYMQEIGFTRGVAVGCLFHHPVRDVQCAVYGDDFTSVGAAEDLEWLES